MNGPNPNLIDSQGRRIRIGQLIGRGGEGAVYEVEASNLVAKVYHAPLSPERSEKIRLMASLRNDQLLRLTAWPIDLLSLDGSHAPVGLLMPKIAGRTDIHNLYSPKSRRTEFQQADWRLLIRAAANTARAFGVVQEVGCIIGDVNHGSVLVAQDATVRLIDCDSFQIITRTRRFLCEVGVETFTPPELQGKPFKGVVRTANHDNFGLGVMTFLLLFMGRHPFAGRFLGRGDMPIPQAIQENRFAYGARRAGIDMERPPGTPALSIVGDEVAFLFERAFAPEMISGGRPLPRDWIEALERLEKSLKQCSTNPSHWHRREQSCPWCPMEGSTGVHLFSILARPAAGIVNVDVLWHEIEAVANPGPIPALAVPTIQPAAAAKAIGRASHLRKIVASGVAGIMIAAAVLAGLPGVYPFVLFIGGIAAFFVLLNVLDKSKEVRVYEVAQQQSLAKWSQVEREWQSKAGPLAFDQKRTELQGVRQELKNLATLRLRMLDELQRNRRTSQLLLFLDRFEIDSAKIPGVGAGRKQTLASYGIETAADLTPAAISKVPGFGPKTEKNLLEWRESVERRFVFDAKKPVDPREVARVEQDILLKSRQLEGRLRNGFAELKQTRGQIIATRQHAQAAVTAAYISHLQAMADYKAAKSTS